MVVCILQVIGTIMMPPIGYQYNQILCQTVLMEDKKENVVMQDMHFLLEDFICGYISRKTGRVPDRLRQRMDKLRLQRVRKNRTESGVVYAYPENESRFSFHSCPCCGDDFYYDSPSVQYGCGKSSGRV